MEKKEMVGLRKLPFNLTDSKEKMEDLSTTISRNLHSNKKNKLTLGQKTADWMRKWAGSWPFIFFFFIFLITWIMFNVWITKNYSEIITHDPYPFILLNLILSCLAAIQAPVILMSQNRAAERDRLRAEYDYQVNRKAEREIRDIKKQLNKIEKRLNKNG